MIFQFTISPKSSNSPQHHPRNYSSIPLQVNATSPSPRTKVAEAAAEAVDKSRSTATCRFFAVAARYLCWLMTGDSTTLHRLGISSSSNRGIATNQAEVRQLADVFFVENDGEVLGMFCESWVFIREIIPWNVASAGKLLMVTIRCGERRKRSKERFLYPFP